ncbi:cytochrome P450 [Dendrothele bispora CBS 962.96]|uniref:Cytochrome P450 n=1 Tax=Dendrothele bispora (strain CBS 962.96) TaxID=1314807 RepID=A0A4S8M4V0_DENBC|nr:cytochrome P450 [Dendrothele bispora CBS 962.96]
MAAPSILELFLVGVVSFLWVYLRNRKFQHHDLANLPSPEVKSWWKGNYVEALNPEAWDFHLRLLKEYGPAVRLDGFMGDKQLITYDPKALHHILVKDQALYERQNLDDTALFFGRGLTGITGEPHCRQRRALSPVFSIAHMRDMLPIFYDVVRQLENGLSSKFESEAEPKKIEMLSWMSRAALELIGQAGLGYSFDTLEDDAVVHPYTGVLKQLVTTLGEMWMARRYVLPWAMKIGSPSFRRWVLSTIPWKNMHWHIRDISDYTWQFSKEIYEEKKKALAEGDEAVARQLGKGKDIKSILMRLNLNESDPENKLEEDEVYGQMSLVDVLYYSEFISSLNKSAQNVNICSDGYNFGVQGALVRVLHLLSIRPTVQDRLRQEVIEARSGNGDIPYYDQLVSLPYLEAICRETLRLRVHLCQVVMPMTITFIATVPFPTAQQDMILPLSKPITGVDGTVISEIHVPKDTRILVSILNSNRNPALWGPDALEWKPERWLSPLPDDLIKAHIPGVYSHLMTFNAGGRSCIGFKFSQLEMKAVLSMLIAKFKFIPSDKTVSWQMNGILTPCARANLPSKHIYKTRFPRTNDLSLVLVNVQESRLRAFDCCLVPPVSLPVPLSSEVGIAPGALAPAFEVETLLIRLIYFRRPMRWRDLDSNQSLLQNFDDSRSKLLAKCDRLSSQLLRTTGSSLGETTISETYIVANKNVKLEQISCTAGFGSRSSSDRQRDECLRDQLYFTPSGGGPDPNDRHVIADALHFKGANSGE